MTNFSNSKKERFIKQLPRDGLESPENDLTIRCKFNFSYFCKEPPGQDFSDWTPEQQKKLYDKLIEFSRFSLPHWQQVPVGRGSGRVLSIYKDFPRLSKFKHPPHVPHDAHWARFRIGWSERLVGFTVPLAFNSKIHEQTQYQWDANTFYVVFLDKNHEFYADN